MSATRILWGQIACVLTIVLITTWAATQWTAWRLGYQPQLGHPWFELAPGVPIYLPPAFFWWWYAYDAYAPRSVRRRRLRRCVGRVHLYRRCICDVGMAGSRGGDSGHVRFCTLGEPA